MRPEWPIERRRREKDPAGGNPRGEKHHRRGGRASPGQLLVRIEWRLPAKTAGYALFWSSSPENVRAFHPLGSGVARAPGSGPCLEREVSPIDALERRTGSSTPAEIRKSVEPRSDQDGPGGGSSSLQACAATSASICSTNSR